MDNCSMLKKNEIVEKMKRNNFRITKQRLIVIDSILESNSCCKDIYYRANKKDKKIGMATVYRVLNTLEEIGVIIRENGFRVKNSEPIEQINEWKITMENNASFKLTDKELYEVIHRGLLKFNYIDNVDNINIKSIEKSSSIELLV